MGRWWVLLRRSCFRFALNCSVQSTLPLETWTTGLLFFFLYMSFLQLVFLPEHGRMDSLLSEVLMKYRSME